MNHAFIRGMVIVCLANIIPTVVEAQSMGQTVPINCTITRTRPVYSTQLRPQQMTVYRDVTETQLTHQNVVENVPTTTCKNVTVDEGGYQMVWVPKPVTKQVAQTVIQQQVKTVAVPVQVKRRVPQTVTQMVPVQTVQYVNETVPVRATACSTCGGGSSIGMPMQSMGVPVFGPQLSNYPGQYQPQQYSAAAIPTMPAIELPQYQTTTTPMPRRESSFSASGNLEETVRARGVPTPQDDVTPKPRKTSMFQGAPAAASVWRTQESYSR